MKKYQFGTAWADWAWDLVGNNKIILDSPQHNGPFDHSKDSEMLFFVLRCFSLFMVAKT